MLAAIQRVSTRQKEGSNRYLFSKHKIRNAPDEVVEVVDEPGVLQQGSFRAASGAAGEDDVCQAIGVASPFCRPLSGIDSHFVPVCVQVHPLCCWREGNDSVNPGQAQQHRHLSIIVVGENLLSNDADGDQDQMKGQSLTFCGFTITDSRSSG